MNSSSLFHLWQQAGVDTRLARDIPRLNGASGDGKST